MDTVFDKNGKELHFCFTFSSGRNVAGRSGRKEIEKIGA